MDDFPKTNDHSIFLGVRGRFWTAILTNNEHDREGAAFPGQGSDPMRAVIQAVTTSLNEVPLNAVVVVYTESNWMDQLHRGNHDEWSAGLVDLESRWRVWWSLVPTEPPVGKKRYYLAYRQYLPQAQDRTVEVSFRRYTYVNFMLRRAVKEALKYERLARGQ